MMCYQNAHRVSEKILLNLCVELSHQSMNLILIIQYQYFMLPFQNNLSQYIADLYASTSYYQPIYLYPNQDNCWNPLNFAEQPAPAIEFLPHENENQQKPQDNTHANTRIKRTREKVNRESSASCQSGEEQSQDSPDFKSRQKYGRNINSNIFHQMLKAVRSQEELDVVMDRLLQSGHYEITKKQFHQILHKRLSKLNPYVTNAKMSSFLNGTSKAKLIQKKEMSRTESDFLKMLRILCRYYLANVHLLYVFNKLKLQKQSKVFHIHGLRKISEFMIK